MAARVTGLRLVAHRPCPWPHLYDLAGNMGIPSNCRENLAARVIGLRLVAHRPCPWPHLYDLPGNMGTTLNPSRRLGSMCHRPAACCASPGCFKASSSTVGACFTTSFMADSTASWVALPASAYGFTWAAFARAPLSLSRSSGTIICSKPVSPAASRSSISWARFIL